MGYWVFFLWRILGSVGVTVEGLCGIKKSSHEHFHLSANRFLSSVWTLVSGPGVD